MYFRPAPLSLSPITYRVRLPLACGTSQQSAKYSREDVLPIVRLGLIDVGHLYPKQVMSIPVTNTRAESEHRTSGPCF